MMPAPSRSLDRKIEVAMRRAAQERAISPPVLAAATKGLTDILTTPRRNPIAGTSYLGQNTHS